MPAPAVRVPCLPSRALWRPLTFAMLWVWLEAAFLSSSVFSPFGVTATSSLVPVVASVVVARRTGPAEAVVPRTATALMVPLLTAILMPLDAVSSTCRMPFAEAEPVLTDRTSLEMDRPEPTLTPPLVEEDAVGRD